jgi:hypothetical protein
MVFALAVFAFRRRAGCASGANSPEAPPLDMPGGTRGDGSAGRVVRGSWRAGQSGDDRLLVHPKRIA